MVVGYGLLLLLNVEVVVAVVLVGVIVLIAMVMRKGKAKNRAGMVRYMLIRVADCRLAGVQVRLTLNVCRRIMFIKASVGSNVVGVDMGR